MSECHANLALAGSDPTDRMTGREKGGANAMTAELELKSNPAGFWYITNYGERYKCVLEEPIAIRGPFEEGDASTPWIPPSYKITGSGPWPDWMAYPVPLISEKALHALRDLMAPHSELHPWIREPSHSYTLVNVLTRIPKANWSCETSSVYGGEYAAADVIGVHGVPIPHLFRLEGYDGKTFVSSALAQRSVELGLKGVAFVDPRIPEVHLGFIPIKFGRKGTGFVLKSQDLPEASSASIGADASLGR
jgi:hypothetical protein